MKKHQSIIVLIIAILLGNHLGADDKTPTIKFKTLQVFTDNKEGIKHIEWTVQAVRHQDQVFFNSYHGGAITYFDINKESGKLTYAEQHRFSKSSSASFVHFHNNKAYMPHFGGHHDSGGLRQLDYDAKTKKFTPVTDTRTAPFIHVQGGPNGKFYSTIHKREALQIFSIDKNGKATLDKVVNGKGFGRETLKLSADKKFLYSINRRNFHIGWAKINTDGSLTYGSSMEIKIPRALKQKGGHSILVSPDNKHLYISSYSWRKSIPQISIYSRNQETGALTHLADQTKGIGPIADMVIEKSGKVIYAAQYKSKKLRAFYRNEATGALTLGPLSDVSDSRGNLYFNEDSKVLYSGGYSKISVLSTR